MDANGSPSPLRPLVGSWRGSGRGFFPTLEPFTYREELDVGWAPGSTTMLHYVQRTWKITDDGEKPSHQETGYITLEDESSVKILNAQGVDRVEVSRGTVDLAGGRLTLRSEATVFANDYRMISAGREITVNGDTLSYTMWMTTDRVPAREGHLEAELQRS